MAAETRQPEDRWQTIRELWRDEKFLFGIFAGIGAVVVFVLIGAALFPNRDDGYATNLYTELISVTATIVILDRLNERRQRQREARELKALLIRELGSTVNDVAVRAAELLYQKGWLQDGSLRGAFLYRANLRDVTLIKADLRGCMLRHAKLQAAHLDHACLIGADLSGARFDEETTLPDNRWDPVFRRHTSPWTSDTDMARYTDPKHPNFWQPEWVREQTST